ncbi:MAG: hypothetical protein WCK21_05860 [Actinomycetota bacterium]
MNHFDAKVRLPILMVLMLAAGGCGGDSKPAATTPATTTDTTPVTTGATPASTGTSSTIADGTTSIATIRTAFTTFFTGGGSVDAKVAVLQDGERYRPMLTDAAANAQFRSLTIDIRDIRLATAAECGGYGELATCAVVTYDLLVGGAPMLAAHQGYAVRVDGTWKVASSAWCAVVKLGGETCP